MSAKGFTNISGIPPEIRKTLNQKIHLAGAWMTEKYFAATPYTCHNQFLDKHENMQGTIVDCIMAYGNILLKLKDFEGIYATAGKK